MYEKFVNHKALNILHFEGLVSRAEIIALLQQLMNADIDVIKTENLYTFDGERGFALAQGQ